MVPPSALRVASARVAMGSRDYHASMAACEEGLRLAPGDSELLNARAVCLHAMGKSTEATKEYQLLLGEQPNQLDALNNYGVLLIQQQYFKHAADLYTKLVSEHPSSAHFWNNLALALKGCGRVTEAHNALANACMSMKASGEETGLSLWLESNASSVYSVGFSWGKDHSARECWEKLQTHGCELQALLQVQAEAKRPGVWGSLGLICRWLTCYSEHPKHKQVFAAQSRLSFAKLLEAEPGCGTALLQLALLAAEEGDYHGAVHLLKCTVKAIPESLASWNNLGVMLQLTTQTEDAELILTKALELAPRSHCIWNNLGVLYRQQGKFSRAQNAHDRCLELKPDYAPAYNNLGLLYITIGPKFYPNAEQMFTVAHKIDSSLLCASSNLARLKAMQLLEDVECEPMEL